MHREKYKTVIDQERLWSHLLELGTITDPARPYTRRSFTERFLEGRTWLAERMKAAGLTVSIDAAGNLIGRKEGQNAALGTLMIGSHSDTVPSGGRFDGIAGVIAGIECAEMLQQRGILLNHHLEIVDFLAEEPSEWGISCIGSRGMSGFLTSQLLATPHPESGEKLSDAVCRMGGDPTALQVRTDLAAFLELHIEQGEVLEAEKIELGIVTGIVGIVRLSIALKGQANHAGTTPMHLRRDTLTASSALILAIESIARRYAQRKEGYFVATCGQLTNKPNASNVVPGYSQLILDIRSDVKAWVEEFVAEVSLEAKKIADERAVQLLEISRLTDTYPFTSDPQLLDELEASAKELAISTKRMVSGAGHDAAFMGHIAPAAMIFVPSLLGKSHCPEEWTEKEELARGVALLMETLLRIDAKLSAEVE